MTYCNDELEGYWAEGEKRGMRGCDTHFIPVYALVGELFGTFILEPLDCFRFLFGNERLLLYFMTI
jgi:hypothetical protein